MKCYKNTIDTGDATDGSDGGYDRHGNRISPDAMREIIDLRKEREHRDNLVGYVIELIQAHDRYHRGLMDYVDEHGLEHSIEDCPMGEGQPDGCECPEHQKWDSAMAKWYRREGLAKRALLRITGKAYCTLVDERIAK